MANIDRQDVPNINSVIRSRNWEVVQGDQRAIFGIRFRDSTFTTNMPVYDPIHASEWEGRILERRSAAGATPLQAPLTFNNVNFSFNSGNTVEFSNREV